MLRGSMPAMRAIDPEPRAYRINTFPLRSDDMRIRELVESGVTPERAREQALQRFGDDVGYALRTDG